MTKREGPAERLLESDRVVGRMAPVWFVTKVLGVEPWRKQEEILNAVRDHNYVAVRACNGSGKTFAGALAAIWWLMVHDEAVVITTAPTERQVKEVLWREIRALHRKARHIVRGKMSLTRLELSDKRFAFGFTTNIEDRFQGFHSENILAIVDEASGVRDYIFDAIFGCLTSSNSKMLMLGNPMKLWGTFYDAFHKDREVWKRIHISAFDTPAFEKVDSESVLGGSGDLLKAKGELSEIEAGPGGITTPYWAQRMAKTRGLESPAYRVRVLGEFPVGGVEASKEDEEVELPAWLLDDFWED